MPLGVLAAALVLPLALSACAALDANTQAKVDTGASIACAGMEAADTIFGSYAKNPANGVSADKVALEAKVYAGVHEICKPPYTADLPTLIKKATDAAVAITALMAK